MGSFKYFLDEYFEFLGQICEGNGGFWEAKLNKNDVFWNCGRIFADFLIRKWFIGIAFMKTDVLRQKTKIQDTLREIGGPK